jgi:glycosyltransferase involved in cell wall biosynthesis
MPELVSIVVPVRNEHDNIAPCLARLGSALRETAYEILIVYDRPDDSTLPAIDRIVPRPDAVRLVQNTLGPSPSFAIRAGMAAAKGDVIVVTMADLSDPPEAILAMARAIRSGADVVSGSRYMRGGSQTGGPRVKTLLSRAAGLSLAWIAGVGTHDATTSFRAFSRRFVDGVPLESRTGFTFGIESTVKAHHWGFVVEEVPSSWADRTAGQSNFRVAQWLGAYLRWYLAAMFVPLAVWGAWILQGVLVAMLVDLPSPLIAVPAASFVLILAARSLRRRMSAVDIIIPLALLHPIADPRAATPLGWAVAAAFGALPVLLAWTARKRR